MLSHSQDTSTSGKLVLYWDDGRGKKEVPKADYDKVWAKELKRLNTAFNYQAAMDLQLIEQLKQTNEDQALELEIAKAALVISDNSLNNARKHITKMGNSRA